MRSRWRTSRRLVLITGLVSLALTAAAAEPTVIVLSWDGVRHDYLDRTGLPALARMQRDGARADRLIPPFPSSTFPGHVTLATGAYTDRHGIVANHFFDPERRGDGEFDYSNDASWIDAEPLWAAAERQGVTSAVFFWVGSETDWRGRGARYRVVPFESRVSERKKVDQIFEWLDLPAAERPRLILSYWHGADRAGHRGGPDTPDVAEEMRGQDEQLGRLLAGLDARAVWDETTLLIVSDHGMVGVTHGLDAHALMREADVAASVVHASALAMVYLNDPDDDEARQRALDAFARVEGVDAFASNALPAHLRCSHPSRLGQIVAIASPPLVFRSGRGRGLAASAPRALGRTTGAHGYDPRAVPEMAGILVALGRGVGRGVRLPAANMTDLAPTVAALLGIDPPEHSEGRAIDLQRGPPADAGLETDTDTR
jgi:arylsulfatase A-like enzyme